jgi:DNA-binding NarL/FixJ family response regulator
LNESARDIESRKRALLISLLLADDNPDMLAAVVRLLEPEFQILDTLSSGQDVLTKLDDISPEIIILDISLGDLTGFQVLDRLRQRQCRSKVLFLSVHENLEFVRAAVAMGADGYVYKSHINQDLVRTLRAVAEGRRFFPGQNNN